MSEQIQVINFRTDGMHANPINGIGSTNEYLLRYLKTALDLLDF